MGTWWKLIGNIKQQKMLTPPTHTLHKRKKKRGPLDCIFHHLIGWADWEHFGEHIGNFLRISWELVGNTLRTEKKNTFFSPFFPFIYRHSLCFYWIPDIALHRSISEFSTQSSWNIHPQTAKGDTIRPQGLMTELTRADVVLGQG